MPNKCTCPSCDTDGGDFCEGEYVDVGVGLVQCSPDFCMQCGYIQIGGTYDEERDLTVSQYRKCWELQYCPSSIFKEPSDAH